MQQYQQVMALAPRPRTKVIPLSHAPSVVLILSWAVKVGPLLGDATLHSRRWWKRHFNGKIFGKSNFLVHSISLGSVNFTRTPTKVRLIGCSLSASRCDSDLITLTSCVLPSHAIITQQKTKKEPVLPRISTYCWNVVPIFHDPNRLFQGEERSGAVPLQLRSAAAENH